MHNLCCWPDTAGGCGFGERVALVSVSSGTAETAAREHEGASSGTRSCISRSSAAQLGSACAPTAHSHTRLLRWCCCCCRVTFSSGTAETAVCMPLDQMVLLLLPSQSVLALPRPQLVNGRAVTISSGTAETAVCMPLSAAAHSEPHSQRSSSRGS